jgi:hypothetical protein
VVTVVVVPAVMPVAVTVVVPMAVVTVVAVVVMVMAVMTVMMAMMTVHMAVVTVHAVTAAAVHHMPTAAAMAAAVTATMTAGVRGGGGESRHGDSDRCRKGEDCSALEHFSGSLVPRPGSSPDPCLCVAQDAIGGCAGHHTIVECGAPAARNPAMAARGR